MIIVGRSDSVFNFDNRDAPSLIESPQWQDSCHMNFSLGGMATTGLTDGEVFNLQPSGCPVQSL